MTTCPAGHEGESIDFCDVCGIRIGGAPSAQPASSGTASSGTASSGAVSPGAAAAGAFSTVTDSSGQPAEPCPQCGTARSGQFCEACGFDFTAPSRPAGQASPAAPVTPASPAAPAAWTAVVTADRAYFETVIAAPGPDAATLQFPGYCPERRFRLSGPEMRIGRRSVSRGLEPEIDLTGPPADPGISHLHAVLLAGPGGSWAVIDPGSANGTQVNDVGIATGVPVPLHDGDRICIGAWTVLTIATA